jgi:hypothetical protein
VCAVAEEVCAAAAACLEDPELCTGGPGLPSLPVPVPLPTSCGTGPSLTNPNPVCSSAPGTPQPAAPPAGNGGGSAPPAPPGADCGPQPVPGSPTQPGLSPSDPTNLLGPSGPPQPNRQPNPANQSFTADTQVLLASGKTAPISSLKPGDKVQAHDTATGKNQPETVAAVEVHHDTNLYDLNVKTPHGVQVIHTTANHLFWDPHLHQWIPASKLKKGGHLQTPDGTTAIADGGITPKDHQGWMWDLTIPGNDDHDFYVLPASASQVVGLPASAHGADGTPILVHNANEDCINWSPKSVKTFGHTFSDHAKSIQQLADRARATGSPQGRWLDSAAAAEFLRSVWAEGAGAREVPLPPGLGEVVFEDGTTVPATMARLVQRANGMYKTAFPILEDGRGG